MPVGVLVALVALLFAGCTIATRHSAAPYRPLDAEIAETLDGSPIVGYTEYAVEDRPTGFQLSVFHRRYQLVADMSKVERWCRTVVARLARVEAAERGRLIAPIPYEDLRVDTGRDAILGMNTCSATADAEYAR